MVRVTAGVEAHTHEYIATAHEDQKFGFSISSGDAFEAVRQIQRRRRPGAARAALPHRLADLRLLRLRGRRPPGAGPARPDRPTSSACELPELDLGGGFGIAYTTQDDPSDAAQLATEMTKIVTRRVPRRATSTVPRLSIEPGRAIAGPAMCTVYEVGTVKAVELDGGAVRTYVSVDGGMSDNIRTALYDADYSCTLANRRSEAPPLLARLVGKHCEAGDIVVKDEFLPGDVAPGDLVAVPGTGAYCRSMASNYNHAPAAPGGRGARRRVAGRRAPGDRGRPAAPLDVG